MACCKDVKIELLSSWNLVIQAMFGKLAGVIHFQLIIVFFVIIVFYSIIILSSQPAY